MPAQDDGGQVSEASNLENADEPIMPDQSVAGSPDAESGDAQEGKAGPNAQTGNDASGDNDDATEDAAADHG